ncbi:hypothetical protein AVXHC19_23230 [Acidovorax sacchari]
MAILFPPDPPAVGSPGNPGKSDHARAPEALPDGPNVAPSAHEHEAAQGCLPEKGGAEAERGPAKGSAAG